MKKITVTSPLLPPLEELTPYLEDIWQRKWLTNNGYYHQQLEAALCDYLGVSYISLFSNGTLALITALQALDLEGEVITTPYSFVATSHAIKWNNLTPVFVDIDPTTFNLDPSKIEAAITDKTCAILPVHVYGNPCDHDAIQAIADKHNLKVIYDAAHAFGVKKDGESILNMGELSILSFHATKAYSTIEGGAVVCHSQEMKDKLDRLKNFGFESETEISLCGMNAKLNEVQAAFGLVTLKYIDEAITKRKRIAEFYENHLASVDGIITFKQESCVEANYSYFPIIIIEDKLGISRNDLFDALKKNDILARRYFYPLITNFKEYRNFQNELPCSEEISNSVICLPIHNDLTQLDLEFVVNVIKCNANVNK
ncbi:DegT/DnrJ/EryC1/StrS family aminotransferase [Vibrio navarrensis]|uniref:Aminotransferase n=1 Tax=Vibrio navarrensis TaxID=29495 RepID=A0A099LS85_9VIBR|nr:DegT/DnrJ/EryC1/StrS family aminotransferase [Vibrio navarrensis]KGK10162.1 aminotransferase [Vibrio navarrensis]MBE4616481.1 aminotransferase [Vibrio navarrensis]